MGEWIGVKDRLPFCEDGGPSDEVLYCVARWGRIGIANVGKDGKWYRSGCKLSDIPTHWQPIPPLPVVT